VTALPGAATVVVTAEDGITTNTYTVNFNVLPNTDASLTTLEISAGEFDFDPGTTYYEVTVPHDTPSVTVTFTAAPQATTNYSSPRIVTISGGTGAFAVQVTAGDGVTKKTYVIMFTELPDTDASLSDLSVNGETVSGFAPEVTSYSIELPYGTKVVPTVTVTTNDPNASYDITQATSFAAPNNVATVLVTAEDGTTTKTYTVTFTVAAPSTDATLSDLRVNNVTVPGFNPYITVYTIDVPYGTTPSSDLVKVTAEANHPNATVNINEATVLPGSTSVVVTAEDGTTTKTYTVYFNVLLNTAAEITSFSFVQQTSPAVIDSAVGTIDIEVAYGTNLTYLIATFELSDYATATVNSKTQISGSTPNNFTSPVTYVVRAAAGNTKDWLVTATVARSSNATISSEEYTVTLDGDSGTINNVPYNTSKNVFLENIRSADGSSQHWDTTGLSDPITDGDILIVTSEDGQTTVTYTIDVIPPSTDAALSDLRYDGSLVSGFDPDTTAYQIELPYGTTQVPTVTATVRDTGRATRAITQATGLTAPNNVARVVVTAEDGITERTYTVTFTVAKNDKAEITAFNLPYAVGPATINSAAGTIAIELGGSDSIDITNLVATFSLSEGATARVNGVLQISEVTANDFTNPVTYVVTAENGIVVKEWTITVTVRVNSITLEGIDGRLDVGLNCILPLVANIKPECASNKTLAWSVQNGTGEATIDQNGVLTGTKVGTVTVQATATDGSGVLSSVPVTIRDYYIAGVAWTPQSGTFELQRLGDGRGKAGGTDFDNLGPWKDMKLCMLSEHNGYIYGEIGDEDFVTDDPYWPVMVKIPQFHYKRVYDPETGTNQFWISNDSKSGFTLHPAFTHRCGKGHDHTTEIYVGAYEAGLMECEHEECQDYDEELHLTSCSGQTPLVSKDMTNFRDYAENRTPGLWTLTDVMARDAIALLYMVEYANLDSQAVLGKGITELRYSTDDKVTVSTSYQNYLVVSSATAAHYRIGDYVGLGSTLGQGNRFASKRITNITDHIGGHKRIHVADSSFSASVNDVLYHVAQLTGGCDDLNGASGSAGGDKTSGKSAVSYRGLENLWGNVNEFVDGINIDNYYHKQEARKPYVSNSMFWYWCNTFIVSEPCDEHGEDYYGYIPVGMTLPANSGWITNFAYAAGDDWLLMPSTTHSTDSSYIPDYYVEDWVNGEPRILAAGGDWFSGAGAGMFHRNVSPFYSYYYNDDQYVNIGARLMFLPFRDCTVYD
nr:cadherin-like beta sandwich domain-containing protein [Peptococcaceae bacterium]